MNFTFHFVALLKGGVGEFLYTQIFIFIFDQN